MTRRVRHGMRPLKAWYRTAVFSLPRMLAVRRLAADPSAGLWISAVAFYLTVKHYVPGLRRRPVSIRLREPGRVWLNDWSELVVVNEVWLRRHYHVPPLPADAKLIVDLGANIGMTALFLARLFPHARVVAYEADPCVLKLARRNATTHPDIIFRHAAVCADDNAQVLFRTLGESWAGTLYPQARRSGGAIRVPGVSLDAIIDEFGPIDVLKIDIEGAETDVIAACRQLDEIGMIVGEFHPVAGQQATKLVELLSGFDFVELDIAGGQVPFVAARVAWARRNAG